MEEKQITKDEYIKLLELENYKLTSALKSLKTSLELKQIILNNTIANEQGKETCIVKFNSIEQFATYLSAFNESLIRSADFYMNRPIEEIKKEVENILKYR